MELWLDEALELKNGRALKIKVKEFLHSRTTPFQKIDVFESVGFGRMFTLDGVVMMTEADEFAYHEMIVHVPMMSHPNPEKVLVIGGGDGGTVREVLKHPSVQEVHLCEIDKGVIDVCYEYFPEIANAMKDPRVKHAYEDGAKYVKDYRNYFDCIMVDSSDPVGPAEVLFKRPFYETMADCLKEGGICTTQGESFYYHGPIIRELFNFIPEIFKHCGYYYTVVPTYPSGIIGFTYCSKGPDPYTVVPDPKRVPQGLKYYSAEMHRAAFVLPQFAQKHIVRK